MRIFKQKFDMKPEIENLKAWIYGKSTTGYQRALGMREFEQLLSYVNELEQLRQPLVSGMLKCVSCENTSKKEGLDCYGKCHICTQAF